MTLKQQSFHLKGITQKHEPGVPLLVNTAQALQEVNYSKWQKKS